MIIKYVVLAIIAFYVGFCYKKNGIKSAIWGFFYSVGLIFIVIVVAQFINYLLTQTP